MTGRSFRPTARSVLRDPFNRGGVVLEFLFTVPLFMMILLGGFEVSRALNTYQMLSNAAYEGARSGSQMSHQLLPSGCFDDPPMTFGDQEIDSNIQLILGRVDYLVLMYDIQNVLHDTVITSQVIKPEGEMQVQELETCNLPTTENNFTISVRVSGSYHPLVFSSLSIPLSVESQAYLLTNNSTFSSIREPNPGGSCGGNGDYGCNSWLNYQTVLNISEE